MSNTSVDTSNYPLLIKILASCVQISRKAGRILHEVKLSSNLDVSLAQSEPSDYANTASELSLMCIVKSLRCVHSKLKLCYNEILDISVIDEYDEPELGVEASVLEIGKHLYEHMPTYSDIEEKDLYIWIDPLNGVDEFLADNRMHEVTILIGIAWKGTPIGGIINQPFYTGDTEDLSGERFLWGVCGLGAFNHVNGKIIEVEDRLNRIYNSTENRIITSKLFSINFLKYMNELLLLNNFEIIPAGQCGFNVLCILDGLVDCFLYPAQGTKRWEICAPEAIMYSIGGRLKNVFGDNYLYASKFQSNNTFGCIASVFNHDGYIKCLNQDILVQLLNLKHLKQITPKDTTSMAVKSNDTTKQANLP